MGGYMNEMLSVLEKYKIVPVVVIDRLEDALPVADALVKGGLPLAEVTFRTPVAADAIRKIAEVYSDIYVGAGTVINLEQCKKAVQSGAKFIVSPGYSEEVTRYCKDNSIPIFPGVCTPTELMRVANAGLPVAKFFPAEQYGGIKTIKAIGAAFPQIKFMPTGGINENNVLDYLNNSKVVAVGGSWMVKNDLIKAGRYEEIQMRTKHAVGLFRNKDGV